uniref:Uncharacterized protein n=1 Tax=Anguilla anguilla TaxID=7936 RepID=A0A0E9XAT3_ANGAN
MQCFNNHLVVCETATIFNREHNLQFTKHDRMIIRQCFGASMAPNLNVGNS